MSETRRVVAVQLAVRARRGRAQPRAHRGHRRAGRARAHPGHDLPARGVDDAEPRAPRDARLRAPGRRRAAGVYRRLAREYGCIVGAGALTIRGRDTRNTYYVCEPDGAVHLHDKDQPSMWENAYYGPGRDDGRDADSRRPDRVRERLRVGALPDRRRACAAGCGCSPAGCASRRSRRGPSPGPTSGTASTRRCSSSRASRRAGWRACSACPPCIPRTSGTSSWRPRCCPACRGRRSCVGETQITDAAGAILERLAYEDGEGYVAADVRWGEPEPLDPVPPRFWMTTLPLSVQLIWHVANAHGRSKYLAMKALHRHPWQHDPAYGQRPAGSTSAGEPAAAARQPLAAAPVDPRTGHRARLASPPMPRPWTVMGVVNVTPDSFSDGGLWLDPAAAIAHGAELHAQGAAILDIGGESTRPGAAPVAEPTSAHASSPSSRGCAAAPGARISIDTSKLAVARAALDAGATYVNDVTALRHDPGWRRSSPRRLRLLPDAHAGRAADDAGRPALRRRRERGRGVPRAAARSPSPRASRRSASSSIPGSASARRSITTSRCCGASTRSPRSASRSSSACRASASWARSPGASRRPTVSPATSRRTCSPTSAARRSSASTTSRRRDALARRCWYVAPR